MGDPYGKQVSECLSSLLSPWQFYSADTSHYEGHSNNLLVLAALKAEFKPLLIQQQCSVIVLREVSYGKPLQHNNIALFKAALVHSSPRREHQMTNIAEVES